MGDGPYNPAVRHQAKKTVATPPKGPHKLAASETWLPQGEESAYLKSLTHLGALVELSAGASLFDQGQVSDSFYVVLAGKMHVSMLSEEGHESILNIMGPGSIIGEAAAFLNQPRISSARAIGHAQLLRFRVSQVRELVSHDPTLALALLYLISIKQRQMVERLRQAIFDPPEERITQFLDQLRETHQDPAEPDRAITVDLTHEQIGNLTGLSRVTVTRVLNKLKRNGVLDFSGKRIVLLRPLPDEPPRQP